MYNKLYLLNEEAALKTHPNNRKRVLRYLEIVNEKGKLVDKPNVPYYESLIIFLNKPRETLYSNINKRCEIMFEDGWVDEVRKLKENNIDINLIKEIGYRDINNYLEGFIDYNHLIDKIKKDTRHYAKRQITWFKNKMNCIEVLNDENAYEKVHNLVENFIKKQKYRKLCC